MPQRRSLAGLSGLGDGISDIGKFMLERSSKNRDIARQEGDLQQRAANDRLNQLLNDFDTSARSISTPEHVAKVGADVARTEYANLKRRLPAGVTPLLGADPDFTSLDSTPDERQGDLTKSVGAITNPDDPALTPTGLRSLATAARVPTDISFPMMGSSPHSDAKVDDPEFTKLLGMVQGQKQGLLDKEPTEESRDPLSGLSTFTTARERNKPGFSTKTGLTPAEEAAKAKLTTTATEQATTDVKNNPTNQAGAARGAGLVAGAQKRAELSAELAQMGITGQQQTGALQLADDFEKSSAPFFTARTALQNASDLAKLGTPQGDIGLIYNVMSSYPGSGNVHQDEYVNAQNAASWPERVRQKWNSLVDGEKLTPDERQGFIDSLKTTYLAAKQDQDDRVKLFTDRATQLRVPARMVVREPSPVDTSLGKGALLQSPLDRARAAAGKSGPKPTVGAD